MSTPTPSPEPHQRPQITRKLDAILAELPADRRQAVEARALEVANLKDLRMAVQQTQAQLAQALGVRKDTISRLEKRSDLLVCTLRNDIESMGGTLELVARFPNRPPIRIDRFGAGGGTAIHGSQAVTP